MTNFDMILKQAIKDNPDKKLRHIICNMYTHCDNCRIRNVCKPWKRLEADNFDKKFENWLKQESEEEVRDTVQKIKHRIADIALMCNENDDEQLNILTALLVLIIDINDEIGGKQ